jgi:hypothetical protein
MKYNSVQKWGTNPEVITHSVEKWYVDANVFNVKYRALYKISSYIESIKKSTVAQSCKCSLDIPISKEVFWRVLQYLMITIQLQELFNVSW